MRKLPFLLAVLCLVLTSQIHAQVGINTSGAAADPSAMLDVTSTQKGILIPRMSSLERVGIMNPATGLLVYDNTTNSFQYWDGTVWKDVGSGGSALAECLLDGDQDTKICVDTSNVDLDEILLTIDGELHWRFVDRRLETTRESVHIGRGSGAADLSYNTFANVAIGDSSMAEATGGQLNVAIGTNAMIRANGGNENTGIGANSLFFNEGHHNTAVGSAALFSLAIGSENVSIGRNSQSLNKTGGHNVAVGNNALHENLSISNLVAIGDSALYSLTGAALQGEANTAVGAGSLRHLQGGGGNTALGRQAGALSQFGRNNTYLGLRAGRGNIDGFDNVFVGANTGAANGGEQNTYLGAGAGANASGVLGGVYLGFEAGKNATTDNRLYIENSERPDPLIYGEFDNRKVEINGGLKVNGPSCGFILPRYLGNEVDIQIPSPEAGTMIFVTESGGGFEEVGFYGFNGEEWRRLDANF